jgi:hypothetical protein
MPATQLRLSEPHNEGYKKNPIYPDTVVHLFSAVRTYLKSPWLGGIEFGLERGFLLYTPTH